MNNQHIAAALVSALWLCAAVAVGVAAFVAWGPVGLAFTEAFMILGLCAALWIVKRD